MDNNNIIEIKNLTLAYDGAIVLRDLSFEVPRGELLLVTGENGSGKSTLICALLGLIKAVSGSICLSRDVKGGIGYLPQKSEIGRDFPATVREVVSQGLAGVLKLGIFPPKDHKKTVNLAMRRVGIEHLASKCFNELSGGQAQRVLLARALCASRKLLILDEPTNALDPESAAHMYSIITSLRDEGMSVIMVSHDLETSVTVADRVLHLCCDGAFCCKADEYADRLSKAHSENRGGTEHECTCGCPDASSHFHAGEDGHGSHAHVKKEGEI